MKCFRKNTTRASPKWLLNYPIHSGFISEYFSLIEHSILNTGRMHSLEALISSALKAVGEKW